MPSRFSDPTGQASGVVYLGASVAVCFVETILRGRGDGRATTLPLPFSEIEAWRRAEVEVAAELQLLDLPGDGTLQVGVPSDHD